MNDSEKNLLDKNLEALKTHLASLGQINQLNGWLPWSYKIILELRQEIAELKAQRQPVGRTAPVIKE